MPAWWAVTVPTPAAGSPGSTDATHAGGLTANPEYAVVDGAVRVFAATATEAAAKALTGTVTVSLGGATADHVFGPATVGVPADHKSFAVAVSGANVAVVLEDMAGFPGATPDWDYNDRTWGGVSVASVANGGVVTHQGVLTDGYHTATIKTTVTKGTDAYPDLYKWSYEVHNISFDYPDDLVDGIGYLVVPTYDVSSVQMMSNSMGWENGTGTWFTGVQPAIFWNCPAVDGVVGIVPGGNADFHYYTDPLPIVNAGPEAWDPRFVWSMLGVALMPGVPTADIDIDDITVGTVPTSFSGAQEPQEDSIGGLVVRRADDNEAMRHKVTVQKLKDQNGAVAVGGKVELTYPGGVKLYDSLDGGNLVASGKKYDQANLPVELYVQGETYSSTMRDVKIAATPVGYELGQDDVSFTVLWVGMDLSLSGRVSPNNSKIGEYRNIMVGGHDNLGPVYANSSVSGGPRWGKETKGLVYPNDFTYPGSDLRLDRDVERKSYVPGRQPYMTERKFSTSIPAGNDTSDDFIRDDNPLDSSGYIYDLDAPGFTTVTTADQYSLARYRANFKAFARIEIDSKFYRPSGVIGYYVRFTAVQSAPGKSNVWHHYNPPDIPGDNTAKAHFFTSLAENLQ